MADLFNPTSKKVQSENNGAVSIRRASFNKHVRKNKRNLNFAEIMDAEGGLPSKNECLLIKTNGCSDTGSIFDYISKTGAVNELYLSTWIISRTNIDYIAELIDAGDVEKLVFVISVRQKQLKKANYAHLVEELNKRQDVAQYKVCNCHAKTFSCRVGDNYYTVTGSGNWTKNPRIENYIILNDKEAFLHNKEWMEEQTNG